MKHDIYINGFIGDVFDFFGDTQKFTLVDLNTQLSNLPAGVTEIDVHINSGGGFITEGFAIHDKLASQPIRVNTIVEGLCGSIATVIAQAPKSQNRGGVRRMLQNSEYFTHNPLWMPSGGETLNADELQKITDELKKDEAKIADFYVGVTGKPRETIVNTMEAENMLSSAEAKDLGFIDEVISTSINSYTRYRMVAILDTQKPKNMDTTVIKEVQSGFTKLENLFNKFLNSTQPKPNSIEVNGAKVYYQGELKAGTKLFTDEALTTAATVTELELDGKKVSIEAGEIKAIAEPAANVEALQTELAAAKKEAADLKAEKEAAEAKATQAETKVTELTTEVETVKTEFVNLKNKLVTGGFENLVTQGNQGSKVNTMPSGLDADAAKINAALKRK